MPSRIYAVALVLLAWFALSGCPDDCEVACGKLEYCGLLEDGSRTRCDDSCSESQDEATVQCADCLEHTECGTIGGGNCDESCAGTLKIRKP